MTRRRYRLTERGQAILVVAPLTAGVFLLLCSLLWLVTP